MNIVSYMCAVCPGRIVSFAAMCMDRCQGQLFYHYFFCWKTIEIMTAACCKCFLLVISGKIGKEGASGKIDNFAATPNQIISTLHLPNESLYYYYLFIYSFIHSRSITSTTGQGLHIQ
jgi:hypothetical protein